MGWFSGFFRRGRHWPTGDPLAEAAVELVRAAAARRGYRVEVAGEDWLRLGGPDGPYLATANLRQLLTVAPRTEWDRIATDHVEALLAEDGPDPGDWDAVQPHLRVRVVPAGVDLSGGNGVRMVNRPLADGLVEALAIDTPTAVRYVALDDLIRWEVPAVEAYDRGRVNVREDEPVAVEEAGDGVHALVGESYYVTSHLVWLRDRFDVEPHGALVAVPNRHLLLVHPIRDRSVLPAVGTLVGMVQDHHSSGPGAISDQLYWWRGGRLEHQPVEYGPGRATFRPTIDLLTLIERL